MTGGVATAFCDICGLLAVCIAVLEPEFIGWVVVQPIIDNMPTSNKLPNNCFFNTKSCLDIFNDCVDIFISRDSKMETLRGKEAPL